MLEAPTYTRLEPSHRRHYAESVQFNTFTHRLGDTPPSERASLNSSRPPSRTPFPRARHSNDTSRSSSTMVTIPIPHLGSVARVPRHLQHQQRSNISRRSATSSSSRTAVRDVSREALPRGYDGSPGGVLAGEQADLEAARLDINDVEGGRRKERNFGSLKRCLFSCLECWFGWENWQVYYGTPTTRPRRAG